MPNRIDQLDQDLREELEAIILEIRRRPDRTDRDWKRATVAIFGTHGFAVKERFIVPERDLYNRGRVGLVCTRQGLTIAMEFGNRSVKRYAALKLNQVSPTAIRLVGLRCGDVNGEIEGIDRVFSRLSSANHIGAGLSRSATLLA